VPAEKGTNGRPEPCPCASFILLTTFKIGAGIGWSPADTVRQGLTLVHFSAQPKPFWSVCRLVSICDEY
jgi:hypothetical protein